MICRIPDRRKGTADLTTQGAAAGFRLPSSDFLPTQEPLLKACRSVVQGRLAHLIRTG